MLIGFMVFLLVASSYATWRVRREKEGKAKYGAMMPPRFQLGWKAPSQLAVASSNALAASAGAGGGSSSTEWTVTVGPTEPANGFKGSAFMKDPITWAAAADGAFAGSLVFETISKIDPHVIDALQFSTAQELHSLAGMQDYVDAHFFHAPLQSADGWFERLTGYVAEQKAAAFLEHAGHHVVFAPVANQPIWDLMVDGHPVQIKEGLSGVKDFLAHHPGVQVLTGPDVAAAVKDPVVHGLDVLNKDAIHAATNESVDALHGGFTPEFHFPAITLAFSSWRESKLLWDEKTTIERALKNVAFDVGGVGVGGFAGAKAGAAIGCLILPGPGTVVCGIVGGIIGAVGGKLVSTSIRKAPFKAARDAYNSAIESAQTAINGEIGSSQQRVHELQAEYQQRFLQERNEVERDAKDKIAIVNSAFDGRLLTFCETFPRFLVELEHQLSVEEQAILSQVSGSGILRFIFPSDADLYRNAVKAWFARACTFVSDEQLKFAAIQPRSVASLYPEIQRFLGDYTLELASLSAELARVQSMLSVSLGEAEKIKEQAVARVEITRDGLIKEFSAHVERMQERMVEQVKTWNTVIEGKKISLKTEAAAVGVDL